MVDQQVWSGGHRRKTPVLDAQPPDRILCGPQANDSRINLHIFQLVLAVNLLVFLCSTIFDSVMSAKLRSSHFAAASLRAPRLQRNMATAGGIGASKKEGDISSVFASLSGADAGTALPARFAEMKKGLSRVNRDELAASWTRLLERLQVETAIVKERGSTAIPTIDFTDIGNPSAAFTTELRKRGVAVVRGVVPEDEARGYKVEVEEYVKTNPWTKGKQFDRR